MEREGRRDHPLAQPARMLMVLLICATMLAVLAALVASHPATLTASSSRNGGALHSRFSATPVTVSTLDAAQVACPSGISYTSNSTAFALLGFKGTCGSAEIGSQELVIVDATYGLVSTTTALDPLVLTDGLAPADAPSVQRIRYAGLGWSPDGTTYAVAYVAFNTPDTFSLNDTLGSGLLLINRLDAPARVLRGDAGFFAAATASYSGLPIWNTVNDVVTSPIVAAPSLSYAWKTGGVPTAITPLGPQPLAKLPTAAGPRYPVGNPSVDATFTIWQPGIVLGPLAAPTGSTQNANDGAFITSFTSWSPDGANVTMLVAGIALAWPSGGNAASARAPAQPPIQAPTTLIQAPARDAALTAVQRQAGRSGWDLVAWNPGGSLLASIQCSGSGATSVELRTTSNGALVGQAPLNLGASDPGCGVASYAHPLGAYSNPNLTLLWSPDGTRVLVSDQAANTVTEWSISDS